MTQQLDPNVLALLASMIQGQQVGGAGSGEMPNFYDPANPAAAMPNHYGPNDAAPMPNFANEERKKKQGAIVPPMPMPATNPQTPFPELPPSNVTGADAMNLGAPNAQSDLSMLMRYYGGRGF